MIRGILGRRAAGGAKAARNEAGAASVTASPDQPAAEPEPAQEPAEGSLTHVSATAGAARRELDDAIENAATTTAVLDTLSRFNGSTDVEFVTYLDDRLADLRARMSRLIAGLSDEERSLGAVAASLIELNDRRVEPDEARLASVRARTAPYRLAPADATAPGGSGSLEPEPAAHGRAGGLVRRPVPRTMRLGLGRGLRAFSLPVALLLVVALVDASSATSLVPEPYAALPATGVDRDIEFPPLAGDDSLVDLPSARPTPAPTAAVVEVTAAPTPSPTPVPEPPAVTVPTAMVAFHGPTDRPVVALTFDDGWSGRNGRQILDILLREQVPATFFLNSVYLAGNTQLWRDIADAGFPVANHTYRHQDVTTLSSDEIVADLQRNAAAFEAVTGHQMVPLFRPPYGFHNAASDAAAALAGFPDVVLWNATDDDTLKTTDARRIAHATAGGAGAIVLLHVGPDSTPQILGQIIANYRARGYGFVTVMDLLYPNGYPQPAPDPTPVPTPTPSPTPTLETPVFGAR